MCLWHRFEAVNVAINEIIHIHFTNSRLATLNAGLTAAKLFADDFLIFEIRQVVSVHKDFRTAASSCKVDLRVVTVTTCDGLQYRRQLFRFNTERVIFRVLVFEFVFEDTLVCKLKTPVAKTKCHSSLNNLVCFGWIT